MKKILSLTLCLILCSFLLACNSNVTQTTSSTQKTNQTTDVTVLDETLEDDPTETLLSKYKINVGHYCDCIAEYNGLSFSIFEYWDGEHANMPQELSFEFIEKEYTCYLDKTQFSKPPAGKYKYFDDEGNMFVFDTECNLIGADFTVFPNEPSDSTLTFEELENIATKHAKSFVGDNISEYKMSYKLFSGTEWYRFSFIKYFGDIKTSEYFDILIGSDGAIHEFNANNLKKFNEGGKFNLVDFNEIAAIIDIIKSNLSEYHDIPKEEITHTELILSFSSYKEIPIISFDMSVQNHSCYATIFAFYLQ